jgi:transcriptional regulator with XRE-family HTH domain
MDHAYKGFDSEGFYGALANTVETKKVTWKQVSSDTGVSASTLTRMAQGRYPDAASLAALSAWAGLNPADFVRIPARKKVGPEPMAAIATLLRADPRLKPESAQALEAIVRAAYDNLKDGSKSK